LSKTIQSHDPHVIAHRRAVVARLRVRGYTEAEILGGLVAEGCVNPKTKKPWAAGTVHNDLVWLDGEWHRAATASIAQYKARTLARLEEIWRIAMNSKDLPSALHVLKQERELLGLDAAKQYSINVKHELEQLAEQYDVPLGDVVRQFEEIVGVKV
jgi:hypothetical protein